MTLSSDLQPHNQTQPLVFGEGGHGHVVAEDAILQHKWCSVFASASNLPEILTALLPDVKLVEITKAMQMEAAVHIAIGRNTARQTEAQTLGFGRLVSVVHPRACVSAFSQMGAGSSVAAGAVLAPLAKLGMGVVVNHGAVIDHDAEVGDYSHIAQGATVCGHAELGRRVLIGSGAIVQSSVVLGDDMVFSPSSVASSNLLAPGVYSGIPAVKVA